MPTAPKTLVLLPHSHTDIGYTHDPIVVWELQKRFVDRAIELCERTADWPEGSRFRWTIEVLCVLERWLEDASPSQKKRLTAQLQAGNIALGIRYAHGTFLYAPGDIDWELATVRSLLSAVEAPPESFALIQNDVNGFSRRIARRFYEEFGMRDLSMGLNSTMGNPPVPRNTAFYWNLGQGQRILTWQGWIYNCIKRYLHLDDLSDSLEEAWPKMLGTLPENYAFSFVQMSGTIHDNVGPFVRLSDQVRKFNEKKLPFRVELMTYPDFARKLRGEIPEQVMELSGEWNDAWPFGLGAIPQHTASARRAQLRLSVVDELAAKGWVDPEKTVAIRDRARRHLAFACEHTITTHRSKEDFSLRDDALRQTSQNMIHPLHAESLSMLALRDSLRDASKSLKPDAPSLVLANPGSRELSLRLLLGQLDVVTCSRSGMIEHVSEFDREPTLADMAAARNIAEETFSTGPGEISCTPLSFLSEPKPLPTPEPVTQPVECIGAGLKIVVDPASGALVSLSNEGQNMPPLAGGGEWKFGVPVLETVDPYSGGARYSPFMADASQVEQRDPSDQPWNPELRFQRSAYQPCGTTLTRGADGQSAVAVRYSASPVEEVRYLLDPLLPGILGVEVDISLGLDLHYHGLYLPFPFGGEGSEPCRFLVDACGDWTSVPDDQLPGSATSYYQSYRGVAMERGSHCYSLIAPEATLWQFGDFTFGQPVRELNLQNPLILSWIYNNYWFTNFPTCAPGKFTLRYFISVQEGKFDPEEIGRLLGLYCARYYAHPIHPQQPYEPKLPEGALWM